MKIIVTGGAGYLGSVLVKKLLECGHEVRVLDNLLFGKNSLNSMKKNPGLELVEGDIRNIKTVMMSLRDVNAVVHLASIVGDQGGDLNPRSTLEINYLATKSIAELCSFYKKKFLFASTCSVYGEISKSIMTEDSKLVKPISLYAQTKLKSELAIRELCNDCIIFRLGTLFGLSSRMRFDLALNLFIAKGIKGEQLTVFGGNQWRPFIHVQDAADAIMLALKNDWKDAYNISWENFQMKDVADNIGKMLNVPVHIAKDIVDKRNYRVDCSKAKKLGFKPKRTIEYAVAEIKNEFESSRIKDYKNDIYSNYKSLFKSKSIQKKLYTLGPFFK